MAEAEINVISHLLKVESEASLLVKEAQTEANKRLSEARCNADSQFKTQFQKIQSNLESEYNDKIQHLTENHKKKFDEFKSSIEQTEQSVDSFNSFLEKVLNEE